MKIKNWLLLLPLSLVQVILWAQTEPIPPQETISSADSIASPFSPETIEALLSTDISAYQVSDFKAPPGTTNLLEEFEILQKKQLSKEESVAMCELLLDGEHYFFSNKIKQCLFLPQMGVQFAGETDTVNVLISFDCGMVRYYHAGTFQLYYINDKMDPLQNSLADLLAAPLASTNAPPADQDLAIMSVSNSGFDLNNYLPSTCASASRAAPFGLSESSFRINMPALKPIYYVLQEGEQVAELPQIVHHECNLSIDLNTIQQLNNLSAVQMQNMESGAALIVGYLSDQN